MSRDAFDRQVATLVERGYPDLLGLTAAELSHRLAPLRERAATLGVPFVLVFPQLGAEVAMARTALGSKPGVTNLDPIEPARFRPLPELEVPPDSPYLLLDPDRGAEYRNQTPDEALAAIRAAGRTPLTVEEGIAWLTQAPEALQKNHCFSLAGSRCGDRRVPALWISQGHPKLGWCWAGNPHTWLGTASCAGRLRV